MTDNAKRDTLLTFPSGTDTMVRFFISGGALEMLRLHDNGDIYVRGKLVENDKEVVQALREFLRESGHLK